MNSSAEIRKEILKKLVEKDGLTTVSLRLGKPARQINDMLAGRKSFGDKVARDMEKEGELPSYYFDGIDKSMKVKDLYARNSTSSDPLKKLLSVDAATGLEEGLIKCFRGSKQEDRELLLMIANKLYSRNHPNDKTADPFKKHRIENDKKTERQ